MKVSVSGGVSTSHVVVAEKRRCSRVSAIIRLCNPDRGSVNAARDTKRAGASTLEKFHRYQPRNHYFRHPTFHFRLYSRVCSVGQRTVAITFIAQWKEPIATITMLLMPLIGSFFLTQAIIPSLTFIFRSVSINKKRPIVVYLLLASRVCDDSVVACS